MSTPMSLDVVHVVVPAHDEEVLLGRALAALERARASLVRHRPALTVRVSLVLDRCTDASAAIAADFEVDTVAVDLRSVGAARRAGVARAALLAGDTGADRVWIASTDADTRVPPDWLVAQVRLAAEHDLLIGSVRPGHDEDDGLPVSVLREWHRRHEPRLHDGPPHVHGANLGFRLSAYTAVGGFLPLVEHEDVALVEAMLAAGVRWGRGPGVITSARLTGRTPGGFAGYLAALSGEIA